MRLLRVLAAWFELANAARAAALGGPVRAWAAGAAALLVADEVCAGPMPGGTVLSGTVLGDTVLGEAGILLGPTAPRAVSLAELAGDALA